MEWLSGIGHPALEVGYWASQISLVVIALFAAVIAYRQTRSFAFLELAKFLQADTVRQARHYIYGLMESNKPFAEWSPEDKFQASVVCSSFDIMGILLKKKMAPRRLFMSAYASAIQRLYTYTGLTLYLAEMRDPSRNGPTLWTHLDWLYDAAKRINPLPTTPSGDFEHRAPISI